MAFGSRGRGFRGLKWKKTNYGTTATIWCKQSKKDSVYKYTLTEGGTQYTLLIDTSKSPLTLKNRNGQDAEFFPITVLASKSNSDYSPIF